MQTQPIPVREIISPNGNVIIKRPAPEPIKSQQNTLRILIPMSRTFLTPREIMAKHLDDNDISAMTKYISDYQRLQPDWADYRKKIPDILLEKWRDTMNECREKGFCNPHVFKNKIVWNRIMEFERNKENLDQCTLCSKTVQAGNCMGDFKRKANGARFTPCWRET